MSINNTIAVTSVFLLWLLFMLSMSSSVSAARCRINNVSYSYPPQANADERIEIDTTVIGSCVSTGVDYYLVRVDLVDMSSNYIASSSSTPIGYSASNFTLVAPTAVMTPASNGTWRLGISVYVIREGGTNGAYLLDYQTTGNATIQVGNTTPVPEFNATLEATAFAAMTIGILLVRFRHRIKH